MPRAHNSISINEKDILAQGLARAQVFIASFGAARVFPGDAFAGVLAGLGVAALALAESVCRSWREEIYGSAAWKSLVERGAHVLGYGLCLF